MMSDERRLRERDAGDLEARSFAVAFGEPYLLVVGFDNLRDQARSDPVVGTIEDLGAPLDS